MMPETSTDAADSEPFLGGPDYDSASTASPRLGGSTVDSSSGAGGGDNPLKGLTFLDGLALVVSLQIGSGIFTVPAQVSRHVESPAAGTAVWLVAGLMVWTGAASFAELGMAIAENGGVQEFLRQCYGDFMGCLFTWTWVLISKASSVAAITTVCAEYATRAFSPTAATASRPLVTAAGLAALWLATLLNWPGPRAGAKLATGFLVLKVSALAAITAMALIHVVILGRGRGAAESPHQMVVSAPFAPPPSPMVQISNFLTAVVGALFCYNGWETISFVLGDMENPRRDLPKVTWTAIVTVMTGFVLVNISLYSVMTMDELRSGNTPVLLFASKILGPAGGSFFSIIIALSAMGALNANIYATATLCVAASRRRYFPRVFANMHSVGPEEERHQLQNALKSLPRFLQMPIVWFSDLSAVYRWERHVPIYAMLFNSLLSSLFFLVGTFDTLIHFTGISQYFFWFFTALGVFILRRREQPPGTPAPYRTGTWNPIIFCISSSLIVITGILGDVGQGVMLASVIFVAWLVFRTRTATRITGSAT